MLKPLAHLDSAQTPTMLRMGLNPVADSQWLAPFTSGQYQRFMEHKHICLKGPEHPVLADDAALPALLELQSALANHMHTHHSAELNENSIDLRCSQARCAVDALTNMSLWVPDDICILQSAKSLGREPQEDYILTAASVLSPSHWRAKEKFLKPLSEIHAQIPGFNKTLTPKVTRFFNHLKAGAPVIRYNWGIQPGNALNWQSETEASDLSDTAVFYRNERQTLCRLPESGAVVFFIRIDLCSINELNHYYGDVNAKRLLTEHIAALPDEERIYKGLNRFSFWQG